MHLLCQLVHNNRLINCPNFNNSFLRSNVERGESYDEEVSDALNVNANSLL